MNCVGFLQQQEMSISSILSPFIAESPLKCHIHTFYNNHRKNTIGSNTVLFNKCSLTTVQTRFCAVLYFSRLEKPALADENIDYGKGGGPRGFRLI